VQTIRPSELPYGGVSTGNDPVARAASVESLGLLHMPTMSHFRRDHFGVPEIDLSTWRLDVSGSVERPFELSLSELQTFPLRELSVVIECAGHRRAEYRPTLAGLPWKSGAVSEAVWAGTSLANVLAEAGYPAKGLVVLEGADRGPFRGVGNIPFARALPIAKALDTDTLVAWTMNGEPLPEAHGAPVRAVVPGWYGMDSVKWLTRIAVTQRPFMGPFEAIDYRLSSVPNGRDDRLMELPVHSLFTSVADGARVPAGDTVLRGIAWGGRGGVAEVEVLVDGGGWRRAELGRRTSRYGRTHWSLAWVARSGLQTLAVRATDAAGAEQPAAPEWNEGGYANASVQRIRVVVGSPAS
jgi:DMSO/TMAO reductase YedYZ molybdopterin-dependent catalytic subunit